MSNKRSSLHFPKKFSFNPPDYVPDNKEPGCRRAIGIPWDMTRSPLRPLKTGGRRSPFSARPNEAAHGVIRISRAEPSAQDQQQPVKLRRAAFEVEALAGDCDSRELVGVAVFPQVEIDYSVWHATSCLRNLATSSGSSSYKNGKLGWPNTPRGALLGSEEINICASFRLLD